MLVNWHVSVIKQGVERVLCTGVRLDDNWVTVRASCVGGDITVRSRHAYRVAIGYLARDSTKKKAGLRNVRRIVVHPEYKGEKNSKYNIALIQLTPVPELTMKYGNAPCIMSQPDLTQAIKSFKIGMITTSPVRANAELNWIDVKATKIRIAPKLCSSSRYICSRFLSINRTTHNTENAPIYVRYGIRDVDWGLAGLTTSKWRVTKAGKSIVHRHMPLYSYINWFEYIMSKDEKYLVKVH